MFPANRLPIPIYIYYDAYGQRRRKFFSNGLGREARTFYAAKMRTGKNPRVVKADLEIRLFDPEEEG
jgi:hypothetical protein